MKTRKSLHHADVKWELKGEEFIDGNYNKAINITSHLNNKEKITGGFSETGFQNHFWNPEELLASALSNCYLLTFLALAKNRKITVYAYEDKPTVTLEGTSAADTKITEVGLYPTVLIKDQEHISLANEMMEKAHKYCYVANALKPEIKFELDYKVKSV
ncbi:hypothetical protein CJJ23_04310 [Mycoplasmopsis agassizii]|uniref:Uncharacterized protein n=1 Tax=Mycoplasmopsis agassizii TaxID=33922 RepID=A0A1W1X630_9BACT|nr:OsmC family protein [Mycoplasmopsis agassizii]PAF55463.1 hypothetical protein CJF60_02145 [Mycoplasmopsis agassizii]PAK21002.1 hypothetical protein CJJ23_04310 [Mycoplasmopsis agassizii]SMC18911.1 OsmC-like protein [Mycoplasmopsis agassizii]